MADPLFTPQQIEEDASNRIARTGSQSVVAAATVVILSWWVATHAKTVIGVVPPEVWASVQVLFTIFASWRMNRRRVDKILKQDPPPAAPIVLPAAPADVQPTEPTLSADQAVPAGGNPDPTPAPA